MLADDNVNRMLMLTFYACVPWVSMKLLNWQFQYWHFN